MRVDVCPRLCVVSEENRQTRVFGSGFQEKIYPVQVSWSLWSYCRNANERVACAVLVPSVCVPQTTANRERAAAFRQRQTINPTLLRKT